MHKALSSRYLPLAVVVSVVLLGMASWLNLAQESDTDCRPQNLNTASWSTDFCNGQVDFADFLSGGPPKDGIPAITDPDMESIDAAAAWLSERAPVIAVELDGQARAYPQAVLMWHEIANDEIAGLPIAVTFCPLCNSSITFDRRVDGEVLEFGVSGLLRNSDMVMFDRQSDSWWQQLTGEGLVGDYAGALLDYVPSQVISFGSFAERHPDGLVMSRNTGYGRRYGTNPYTYYDSSPGQPFLFRGQVDPRLSSPVAHVLASELDGTAKAYPFAILREERVVSDLLGDVPIVIFFQDGVATALGASDINTAADLGTAGMYRAELEGQLLSFSASDDGSFRDEQTGSTWNAFGEATAGELAGSQLEWVHAFPHFWFAWAAFHPETEIYGS